MIFDKTIKFWTISIDVYEEKFVDNCCQFTSMEFTDLHKHSQREGKI